MLGKEITFDTGREFSLSPSGKSHRDRLCPETLSSAEVCTAPVEGMGDGLSAAAVGWAEAPVPSVPAGAISDTDGGRDSPGHSSELDESLGASVSVSEAL